MQVYRLTSLFSLLLLGFLFSSCEDVLTKNLDIEDDFDFEKVMVVSGALTSQVDELNLLIAENQSIIEDIDEINYINGATVTLSKDGIDLGTFSQNENEYYKLDLSSFDSDAMAGNYLLECEHPSFGSVSATCYQPSPIDLKSIEVDTLQGGGSEVFDEYPYRVTLTFDDPAGSNYYRFNVTGSYADTIIDGVDTFFFNEIIYTDFVSNDQGATTTWSDGILIQDDFFDGQEAKVVFNMYVGDWFEEDIKEYLRIEWSTMSEELFNFKKSYQLLRESQDFGPFQEPVSIYTNVENGGGYFGTEQIVEYSF